MKTNILIKSDRTTPVSVLKTNSELVVNQNISVSTSGTAVIATGTATDRDFYINGNLISASDYAVKFGASGVADSDSIFVVAKTGKVSSTSGGGMQIMSGGLELANHGTIEAKLTTLLVTGASTQIVNNGLTTSSAGTAIKASGKMEVVINNGTIKAAGDTVVLSGASANFTNNGETSSSKAGALVSSGSSATLTNHGTLKSTANTVVSSGTEAKITNDGLISSTKGSAILAKGTLAIVTNNKGTITALKDAVVLTGDAGTVTNNGSITSSAYGISVDADKAIVTNNNTIQAAGGVTADGTDVSVNNTGTITATKAGIAAIDFTGTATSTFENSGLVESTGRAFLGGNGVQKVINTGTIKGSVCLGGGDDFFNGSIGKVTGSVHGGKGNDTYVISSSSTKLVEKAGEGTDLVKSSASYTLRDNFENLALTASGNSSATGNALANQIHGNGGKNAIDGGAGNDTIWGHGGADSLTGGSGSDTFVFAKGDGKDTITDFAATGSSHDILDLTGLSSITDFKDLVKNHMTQQDGYVYIDGLNGDSITLKNVKLAHLHADDFLF
ncbi:Ca2+-binding RTX toxin-like protein [Pararhizobium capsulatum DSM 1112]|uniref:Ca2+-binding RTX toxin-like protein n=1 Tax=Pararhizobium capsulatum DSM 1112 TaxID=1121113 RepID=A0ABU0BMC0_9HYPH|nr:hypothetical protein [Pararhizobium capsulatum]MDQ0319396.1 Ca2+-binding RTX toxin-like protein [Pararhizobium capsulatum DSM 1112]